MHILDVFFDFNDDVFYMVSAVNEGKTRLTILDDDMAPTGVSVTRPTYELHNQLLDGDLELMRRYS